MLLRPIFPMFFFFSPTIDKTCKIYMSRRCCQEKGKNGPSCFFMTIFPVTDKYQHEQCHQICCVSHGTGQATASSHSPSPLWSLGTLPLRNCVAAVPERSTQASHSNQPPPAIFLTANNQSFSLTVPLNMFQPPPLKRLKCLSSSWSVSAIGNVTAARTGMMTLKSCPYLTYFRQLSISNGQWTAFF